jgi:serine/threonine protein kinase
VIDLRSLGVVPMNLSAANCVRIGAFEVDLKAGELHKGTRTILLQEQPFQILLMLVESAGNIVTREEIRKRLWPNDTVVEFDHSIHTAIKKLRQAFDDSADDPNYIETVARRGYRLMVTVERVGRKLDKPATEDISPPIPGLLTQTLTGKKVSHYRVLEILGGGGMGVVYRGEDIKLGRRVALKFLPEELAHDALAMERFEREARAASAFNHPNICTVYEVEEHEGQPFIVMELLEGHTLRELISGLASGMEKDRLKGCLPLKTLLDIATQIVDGLDAAHKKGIIHRDIKPANVFLCDSGTAKILDFGLARPVHAEAQEPRLVVNEENGTQAGRNLTRTGVAIGTAGYMSPEQVRGDKLDARTDLFSLGLVLYEMACGQRAFAGDTAPVLHAAILNEVPIPVRNLNPEIPPKVQAIINKAMEKDCNMRYQSAAEMHADLKVAAANFSGQTELALHRHWPIWAAGLLALLTVSGAVWFVKQQPPPVVLLKQRQLTSESIENPLQTGSISPDGKYLAYTDTKGMHLKFVENGETQAISPPNTLLDRKVEWEIVRWFPDSTRFLANAHPLGENADEWSSAGTSVWIFSVLGGTPPMLRDNARAYSISPDGSTISFGTNKGRFGDREIWLMGPTGDRAHKLYDTDENSAMTGTEWSPDGRLIQYVRFDEAGGSSISRDLTGGPASFPLFPPSVDNNIVWQTWLPDGRLIYSLRETEAIGVVTCNFWATQLDGHTGKLIGQPRRLTNWAGLCMDHMSVTADGKKLAFLKWRSDLTTYVADLDESGSHLTHPRHFTLSEGFDWPAGWTADSRALIFSSNRTGQFGIYKQDLEGDDAEPLLTQSESMRDARVSADGKWVLYLVPTKAGEPPAPEPLMRVPTSGGTAQMIFSVKPNSLILCAQSPSALCATAEPTDDHKQAIVTSFDPLKGRGPELARFALDPTDKRWFMDISPDGTRIAAIRNPSAPICVLSSNGETLREIRLKGWTNLRSVNWTADGKGLFVVVSQRADNAVLLHVDLLGTASVVWERAGGNAAFFWEHTSGAPRVRASPDGRHIAIPSATTAQNFWMLENF